MDIRHLLDEHNANIRIIAKIENQEGIDNIEDVYKRQAPIRQSPALAKRLRLSPISWIT